MNILKFNPKKNKAQAMVEFAIALPVLLLIVYGLIETGRLLFVFISVNNASRQAVRYGSTSGVGPNGVPRYRDCNGIRDAAERSDFLNAFDAYDGGDFIISYDRPIPDDPGTPGVDESNPNPAPYAYCNGSTSNVVAQTGDRVTVTINADFGAIIPKLVPFISRTVAGGNPIVSTSSRTLLLSITIEPLLEDSSVDILLDPSPSIVGDVVKVTVTVTGEKTIPSGQVEITGADVNCAKISLDASGKGTCNIQFTSTGTKTVTASYEGDADHASSTNTASHLVLPPTTVTTITSDSPDGSEIGQTVTVAVKVTGGSTVPTGTVTITGADAPCTITLTAGSGGVGSCPVSFSSTGTYTLTANYSGDVNHQPSSDDETHTVLLPGVTITTITADAPDPSQIGQSVVVSVRVDATTTPTGTITISGADTNCSITLTAASGGIGSCTVSFNSVGLKTLTATYGGDATHTGSSDTEPHAVELIPTTTTITDTPDPSSAGEVVTITVNVTGGSSTPTGTVTVTGASTNCIITLASGTGTCPMAFNSVGSQTLTAAYNGDSTHATSTGTNTHDVAIPGCNTTNIYLSKMYFSAGALVADITNNTGYPLQINQLSFTWYETKGSSVTGNDKSLVLKNIDISGTLIWQGSDTDGVFLETLPSAIIPVGSSKITFSYQQPQGRWDDESIGITLLTAGCNGVNIIQTQHVK